jgi:hypothetical protein
VFDAAKFAEVALKYLGIGNEGLPVSLQGLDQDTGQGLKAQFYLGSVRPD